MLDESKEMYPERNVVFDVEQAKSVWLSAEVREENSCTHKFVITNEATQTKTIIMISHSSYVDVEIEIVSMGNGERTFCMDMKNVCYIEYRPGCFVEFSSRYNLLSRPSAFLRTIRAQHTGLVWGSI